MNNEKKIKIDTSAFKMKQKLKENKAAADKNALKKESEIKLDKSLVLEQYNFSNIEVDNETMIFLQEKTLQVKSIVNKSFDALGKLFSETQEQLARNGYGCFEVWYTELGFKKQTVYNYINRHNLIVQRLDKQELIESLPLKVVYTIANPKCPEELKNKVLNGEIKTFNELLEFKSDESKIEKVTEEEKILNEYDFEHFENEYKKINYVITKDFYEQVDEKKKKKLLSYLKKIEELLEI